MWHKILWGFNVRGCSGFFLHRQKSSRIKKSPQKFTSLAELCIQKTSLPFNDKMMKLETKRSEIKR